MKPLPHQSAIRNVRSRLGAIDRMWHALGSQLRNPTGAAGSIVGWLMALVNDEPNRLAIDALHLGPGERVLELGFGPGWSLRTIAARTRGARVYGVDQSARMLEQATRMNEVAVSSGRMLLVQGPFSPLPWIDEMFDKVLLINVVYFFLFRWLLYVRFLLFVAFVCMCFYVFRVFSSFWFFLLLALSVSSDRGRCV